MRIRLSPALLAATIALAAGVSAAGVTSVSQIDRAFRTKDVTLARGDTLHVTNDDLFVHQIYVESPAFTYESDEQQPGEAVDVRFTAAGTFEVRCHIHPKMLLHVEVR